MAKIIYETKGKAAEYAKYGFSAYLGCSCGCSYCYNKTGRFKAVFGGNEPTLKKCFNDAYHAIDVFEKELKANLPELQKHGLFFSFTTDPMLPETALLTGFAIDICRKHDVPFKILTKRTDWFVDEFIHEFQSQGTIWNKEPKQHLWAFGFTLTGHDELEKGASTNAERIDAMQKLHDAGFKTFASIEPVIDFDSFKMIERCVDFCDLFKVGILSGKKFDKEELAYYVRNVNTFLLLRGKKVYWKDSILKAAGIVRSELPDSCVERDYNLFKTN